MKPTEIDMTNHSFAEKKNEFDAWYDNPERDFSKTLEFQNLCKKVESEKFWELLKGLLKESYYAGKESK